ncbi:coiled-coil domain-containing protein 126 [Chanos chanos]|uniref:Coiled-coil domain-containing protein 126 n=1 Tax=Chanos chanos TaxID=29144 RepID=A0A6J2WNX7_CHACN|nr:coiled-coil domain-containing protein 126 [Chanos chanos]
MLNCLLRRNMSHRLSVFLLLFGLAWCVLLIHYTLTQPPRQSSSELRKQILELSHRYVKALSEENQNPSGPQGTSMAGYADLKRTIAVLLDDILDRLVKLEGRVEAAVNASLLNSSHTAGGALLAAPAIHRTSKHAAPSKISEIHRNHKETYNSQAKSSPNTGNQPHRPRPGS